MFPPRITDHDLLVSYYRRAKVYVHLSFSEQYDLTVMEAMACGMPVVVSQLSPIRSFLTNNKDCLIVNSRSNEDIYLAIEKNTGHEI